MNKEEIKEIEIQIKDKMNLTIKEASLYSNIGESNLRKLLKKRNCPFLLRVGTKQLIKRVEFEEYIKNSKFLPL